MTSASFAEAYSTCYELMYSDKNYTREAAYIHNLIQKNHPQAKTILEYGCGTGQHGLLLNQYGYAVYGLEQSTYLANISKLKGLQCEIADITNFALHKTFDACIALFHVISYLVTNDQLLMTFQNTRTHLKKHGIFIFDAWFTPAVLRQMPEAREKRVADEKISIVRKAIPSIDYASNIVTINYNFCIKDQVTGIVSEFDEVHRLRHFGIPEIQFLSAQTGFVVLRAEEFISGATPSDQTWGINFILQAV